MTDSTGCAESESRIAWREAVARDGDTVNPFPNQASAFGAGYRACERAARAAEQRSTRDAGEPAIDPMLLARIANVLFNLGRGSEFDKREREICKGLGLELDKARARAAEQREPVLPRCENCPEECDYAACEAEGCASERARRAKT